MVGISFPGVMYRLDVDVVGEMRQHVGELVHSVYCIVLPSLGSQKNIGGMMAAWELWEKALIPSLLNGSGTWICEGKKTVDLCDDLQNFFWRVMLCVPESCPKVAYGVRQVCWE